MSSDQNATYCFEYFDSSDHYHAAKQCLSGQYCCGTCAVRTCCSDSSMAIANQSSCDVFNSISASSTNTPNTYYMNISLESVIEICFLSIGLVIVTSFIYMKIRSRIKRQGVLIAPVELMNSSSSSSAYHSYAMSLPPPYPSDCLNSEHSSVASHQIAVTANTNDRNRGQMQEPISTVTLPPPAYSELIKEPNIFLINPNHQTKPS